MAAPRRSGLPLFAGLLCLLALTGRATAAQSPHRRLAVLEFSGRNLEPDILAAFTDAVRGGALEGLAGRDVKVMTRESLLALLKDMGKTECVEGDCEVETARNIGADFVISGIVVHMEDTYVVTLKLHESREGGLLATDSVHATKQIEMLDQLRGHGRDLVAALVQLTPKTESSSTMQPVPKISDRNTPGSLPGPGSARLAGAVHAELHSADPQSRWDVYYDDEAVCSTPCVRWVDPLRPIALRTRDRRLGLGPDTVRIDGLGHAGDRTGAVIVRAHPTSTAELAGGIAMTTFGGTAVLAGAALISVGYAQDRGGMRVGGFASGIPGLLAVAAGIWLMLDARPHATVQPTALPSAMHISGATVVAGPGFLAGKF